MRHADLHKIPAPPLSVVQLNYDHSVQHLQICILYPLTGIAGMLYPSQPEPAASVETGSN